MITHAIPNVIISKCLEHDACRYDGSMIHSNIVSLLKPYVNFIPLCPEMAIGLPVPREALRLVDIEGSPSLVFSKTGEDVTAKMHQFSMTTYKELDPDTIDGFILKHRSPSCGTGDVRLYKGIGKSDVIPKKMAGLFAAAMIDRFPLHPFENEGRLLNASLRDHFLISIFTQSDFRRIKAIGSAEALVSFHAKNKYLFMALSPNLLKDLGQIVANHKREALSVVYAQYETKLMRLLSSPPSISRNINTLQHVFGYFKKGLNASEKMYFLEQLALYQEQKISLSSLLSLLRSWTLRFNEPYLMGQTLFSPYPIELLSAIDSTKKSE